MTNLRDEVGVKVKLGIVDAINRNWQRSPYLVKQASMEDANLWSETDVEKLTTEIFQAIVRALPDKGNIQRYSKGSMGETLMLLSDGYDKCLADIKKLLGVDNETT